MKTLYAIDYQNSKIFVDKEAAIRENDYCWRTKAEQLHISDGGKFPDSVKIVGQYTNFFPNVAYVNTNEEDLHEQLVKMMFRITDESVPLFSSDRLHDLHKDASILLARLLAEPIRRYTENQMRDIVWEFSGEEIPEEHEAYLLESHITGFLQSIKPKVVSIGVNCLTHSRGEMYETYIKNGKTHLKVKKVNYE